MAHILRKAYYKFLNGFLTLERETIPIPRILVEILIVQRSLLELSYTCSSNINTLEYLILLASRPQALIQIQYVEYISAFLSILLIFTIIVKIPGSQYVGIYLQMIRSIVFFSIFEMNQGYVGYFSQVLISLIYLFDLFIIQGTLDVNTKNLQITKNNIINQLTQITNLIMTICYVLKVKIYILIILVILNSLFQLINHLQYSPNKSTHLVIIIASIYTMTLYTAINKFLHYQENFNHELLIFPFIYRIYHTQMYKNCQFEQKINNSPLQFQQLLKFKNWNSPSNQDEIISISETLFKNQSLTAWLNLQEIQCDDTITNFKLQALKHKCIQIVKMKILRNLHSINDIQVTVDVLLRSENSNQTIVSSIINLIHEKIETQSSLIERSNLSQLLQYTQNHINLQKLLEEQYDHFPCNKTQNSLGFFYIEIANDLLAANKLFSVAAISDEHSRIKDSGVFSNEMFYLIVTYTSSGLMVKKASNKAFKTFGIKYEQLINQNLNFLIPNGIVEWHDILIKQFLKKGRSKFMRKLNENYYQNKEDGLLHPIEFAIDINFVNDLNFIVFIQPNTSQPFSMILNQNLEITGFTTYLLQQIRIQYGALINQSIFKILPNFDVKKEYLENVEVNFGSLRNSQSISSAGSSYQTSVQIHKKVLNEVNAYFIIQFEYLKRVQILQMTKDNKFTDRQSPIPSIQQSPIEIMFNMVEAEESVQIIQPYILDLNDEQSKIEKQQEILEHSQRANYFDVSQREDKEYSSMIFSPKQSNHQFLQKQQPLFFSSQEKYSHYKKQDQSKDKYKKERIDLPAIQEDKALDDRASQISSLMGVRKSKYFKKYEIIGKLNTIQAQSTRHKVFYALFLVSLLFQIILALVQLSLIDINLTNLVSDIDLLQIKNLVYQPLESFSLIRWSIFNYNGLYNSQQIDLPQYQELLAYPKSNLALGYDSLAENIYLVLNRRELQSFLQDTQLEVYQYVSTNTGILYNMTLRNAVNVLLNYQYILKMAYQIDGGPVTDSPYIYFPYRNYLPLKQTFSNLNFKILENSKIRAENMLGESITISSISITLLIIIYFLIYITLHKIYNRFSLYITAIRNCEKSTFEYDIAFYKHLSEQIQSNHNAIFKFTFNLSTVESNFKQLKNTVEPKRRGNLQTPKLPLYIWLLFLFSLFILIGGNIFLTFYQTYEYLSLYPDTATFYKQLSDVGTDIPTMYAQREVLFGRIYFPYFDSTDFEAIKNEIVEALNRTLIFTQVDQDFNKLLPSTSFVEYYSKIQNNNLCEFLPPQIKNVSQSICSVAMSSNIQRGLKPILIYIINFIRTDMEINGFESRLNATYLELEGAFLVSELIKQVNTNLNQDLNKSTTNLLFSIKAYNIFIQVFMFLMLIFGLQFIKQNLKHKYYLVQRFIYLVPKKSLFLDDGFERNIKILQISDSIN